VSILPFKPCHFLEQSRLETSLGKTIANLSFHDDERTTIKLISIKIKLQRILTTKSSYHLLPAPRVQTKVISILLKD